MWTLGLEKILSGDPAADGGMGTTLTEHDETLKGTAVLESTDPTITWISTEEKGKRKAINQKDSETTLTFEVANPSLETQAYYCGGAVVTGTDNKKSYSPPKGGATIYKSFRVVTKEGVDVLIPKGGINAKPLSGTIGTENVLTLKVVVTAEIPEKVGEKYIDYVEK
ncbi:hypothetical protein [Elizabethkingia anophelis]|uniref:hypothetical protein n=1 Tax=Elizabethkingia anophelis TaxID=1117645 RepID=UPI00168284A9|nr:hypothetical protein [Elizabethkingia anophelis]QNV11241.1 hypothetical protein EIY88_18720 [Elizabethkingia anophelis]UTF89393.1 hypothetical protein J2N93_18840 [Elizabethkingia anophelis]UTG53867.1 hypothetical protein J2O05_18825 [Elizabethkingia anophelis]